MVRIGIIAGEPSGDLLGAELISALREKLGDQLEVLGVGGPAMAQQGIESLFPLSDIAVMGLAEILPRLPVIFLRVRQTASAMNAADLDVMITIDSLGFNARVAKKVRAENPNLPILQYAAPKLWAWWPGRAKRIRTWVTEILALFPFEPEFFARYQITARFVGHPVVSRVPVVPVGQARQQLGISQDATVLTVLPGSRAGEVIRLADVFGDTVERLAASIPGLVVLVPTIPNVAELVDRHVSTWSIKPRVLTGDPDKFAAFCASDAALAASGTVSLELVASGIPHIVAYKVAPVTAAIAQRLVQVKYASIINILLDEEVVPERIQDACNVDELTSLTLDLLRSSQAAQIQRNRFRQGLALLGAGAEPPAERAAQAVMTFLK